ncbi:MAG: divalent metal cation transporter, partial [Acidobacteriota bacterium]
MKNKFRISPALTRNLGPGLLWAGAAIGVSHLVQSTRAGANYGFALLWIVVLANFFKYPFFEYGTRFAAATGKSLISGYRDMGKFYFILYLILTFGTMFTIQAAVTIVTAGLVSWLTNNFFSPLVFSVLILLLSIIILLVGKYSALDRFMKVIIIILSITTLVAFSAALGEFGLKVRGGSAIPGIWNREGVLFMIALMGWMPSAIDISVWSSIWTIEKNREHGKGKDLRSSLFDFNLGYIGTSVISILFLSLGAMVMCGSGEVLSGNGSIFSGQLISLYTASIGGWSRYFIAIAAITTMFSTTITCLDAFSRVMRESTEHIFGKVKNETTGHKIYILWMIIVAAGAVILLSLLKSSMVFMVTIATTLSFLTAPVLAVMNYKVVTGDKMPLYAVPPRWMVVLSWA